MYPSTRLPRTPSKAPDRCSSLGASSSEFRSTSPEERARPTLASCNHRQSEILGARSQKPELIHVGGQYIEGTDDDCVVLRSRVRQHGSGIVARRDRRV